MRVALSDLCSDAITQGCMGPLCFAFEPHERTTRFDYSRIRPGMPTLSWRRAGDETTPSVDARGGGGGLGDRGQGTEPAK